MPPTAGPVPDLSPQLFSLLVRSTGLLGIAAAVVGVTTWVLARRRGGALGRLREISFGAIEVSRSEPSARRFLRQCLGLLWIVDGLLQAQPDMPGGGFTRDVLEPGLTASPSWLADLVRPVAHVWMRHPVTADAVTVWIQVGLGLLILLGGRGIVSRAVLWLSAAWSLWVWVVGEFVGGLLTPGASWLTGAPGAALVYAIASALLLAPWQWWQSGLCTRLARRIVGGWILLGAALQALPWEGSWSARGLAQPFADAAQTTQPSLFRSPIATMASWSLAHPAVVNGVLICLLVGVGVGLCVSERMEFFVGGLILCAATWWLGEDFGVLGGTGTDPGTTLPLALLLFSAWPAWSLATARPRADAAVPGGPRRADALREPSGAAIAALGLGSVLVAPLIVAGLLVGPADATAVAADSEGGVVSLSPRPAPDFALIDQRGRSVSMHSFRGKVTLVTFLDPVCSDECPVIANQLAIADAGLGSLADRVEIVAIDTNPVFHEVSDVAAFTSSHGLDDLPNWHFLAGSAKSLQDVLASYGVTVAVPSVGMIGHSEGIYFVSPDGAEAAYLGDGADPDLTVTYGDQVRNEVRKLVK